MSERVSKVTIDHDEIRRFAEARGGKPSVARGTDVIRLDFPGFSGEGKLKSISWDEWFDRFDDANLALVYEESTARAQKSNFNKLIGRETVDLRTGKPKGPPRRRAKQGARTEQDARRLRSARAGTAKKRSKKTGGARAAKPAAKRGQGTTARGTRRTKAKTKTTRQPSAKTSGRRAGARRAA